MTQHMFNLVRSMARHCMKGAVLEIGSYIERGQEHLNLREAFPTPTEYLGVDVNDGDGVDRQMDLLNPDQVADVARDFAPTIILCLYVLEHVWEIRRAAQTLGGIWKQHPNAWLLVATHQNQSYHGTEKYQDYWRITAEGLRRLMEEAGVDDSHILVEPDPTNPSDVLAVRQPAGMVWPADEIATCAGGHPWFVA